MNEKIVFFDIDGTLVDDEKKIPDSTKQAIADLQKKGIHVAIATGRGPFMFEDIRKELGIKSFVSYNGSFVMFEGEVIHKSPLHVPKLVELETLASKNGHPLVYLDHQKATSNVEHHDIIHHCTHNLMPAYPAYHPSYYNENEVYQVLLFCEEVHEQPYLSAYKDTFGFIRWHKHALDVLPLGGSKAKGIDVFIEKIGIPRENTFAFGDALNDIEMLQSAGMGIAMGNGLDEAKKAADFVTKPVSDDGIYHGLKHVGLL